LSTLESLGLSATNVTPEGIAELKLSLPNLNVGGP